ncbi:MAG: DUF1232 domain-containing protein [Chloroflexota bacterium]|nr:DUF1232 domain-containing protein [Chloroflexota bacterium]
MDWWHLALLILVSGLAILAVLAVSAFLVWRMASRRTKRLARRVRGLAWRPKIDLAKRLLVDDRIPAPVRLIVPLLVLYLALPLDLIPDFIPVIGQLDDILVVAIGVALLVRYVPERVLDQHLAELEPAVDGRETEQLPGPRLT